MFLKAREGRVPRTGESHGCREKPASGEGTCPMVIPHSENWESEPILCLLTPSYHLLAEYSRKQRAGSSRKASWGTGQGSEGWRVGLEAQRKRSSTQFGALGSVLSALHTITHLIPTTAQGQVEQHALFNLFFSPSSLWLGAHMEVNLHELKVECFPCTAVQKGQTTQRNAGDEAGEGPRPNPEFASSALYRPTAHSQLSISQRMLMLEGGDHTQGQQGWGD